MEPVYLALLILVQVTSLGALVRCWSGAVCGLDTGVALPLCSCAAVLCWRCGGQATGRVGAAPGEAGLVIR